MKNNTTATGYAEMFEWADGNPTREDRTAYSVTIDHDDKIRIAVEGDVPFGIVAGDNTSVHYISGASTDEWHGKHVRDSAKRLVWEKQCMVEWIEKGYRHWYEQDRIPEGITVPADAKVYDHWPTKQGEYTTMIPLRRQKQTKEYSENTRLQMPYLPRFERKEWAIVVVLGRALLRGQQPWHANWINLGMQDLTIGEFENNLYEFLVK